MSLFKSALLYLLQIFIIQSSVCTNSSTWTLLNETEVNYNISVIVENSIPLMMCLLRCQNTLACIAVQVNEVSSKCELLMHSPPDGNPSITGRSGWTFYEKETTKKGCKNGWTFFQESCYFFGNTDLAFSDAEDFCNGLDTHLANVETLAENSFLRDHLRNWNATSHWIGMTDEQSENVWRHFPSGVQATFFAWLSGEPNQGISGNCVELTRDHDYLWVDEPCTFKYKPICEKRLPNSESE